MNSKTYFKLAIGLCIIAIAILFLSVQYFNIRCETCDMCEQLGGSELSNGLWGYYDYGDFYCVWVKGRTEAEITNTENHEICHHLVQLDWKHFCEEQRNDT